MVNELDVFRREEAHVSVATTPPAQRIRAVEHLDDIAAEEAQLVGMVRREVEEGMGVMRALQRVIKGEKERLMANKLHKSLLNRQLCSTGRQQHTIRHDTKCLPDLFFSFNAAEYILKLSRYIVSRGRPAQLGLS